MCEFGIFLLWGEVGKFRPSWLPHESHLGKLLRDGCARVARVKFGISNVRRVHVTDI